jgi:NADH-quinone oxidoreductase subunit I
VPSSNGTREKGFWSETYHLARAIGRAMGVTLKNLVARRPVTVMYPDVRRQYPDRFRGVLALTYDRETGEENCIGCRLCEYICPPLVIKVDMLKGKERNWAKNFTLELYSCEFCELCVQVCPTDAIVMLKTFELATADRRELLLDKDRLHALGLEHEHAWATGNRLRDMQAPPKAARADAHAGGTAKPPEAAAKGAPAAAKPAAPPPAVAPPEVKAKETAE